MIRRAAATATMLLLVLGVGCEREAPDPGSDAGAGEERLGDTLLVRAEGPGSWGEPRRLVVERELGVPAEVTDTTAPGPAAGDSGAGADTAPVPGQPGVDTATDTAGVGETAREAGAAEGPPADPTPVGPLPFGRIFAVAVAPDGRTYVFDGQEPALRAFDASGAYVGTFGAPGGEAGQYRSGMGLAVLPSGDVVLWDPLGERLTTWSPSGELLESRPLSSPGFTLHSLSADREARLYVRTTVPGAEGVSGQGFLRIAPGAGPVDTLRPPGWDHQPPVLQASRTEGAMTRSVRTAVPYAPRPQSAVARDGRMVVARADTFAVDVLGEEGEPIRILRPAERVPVTEAERAAALRQVRQLMREVDPRWTWTGAEIPERKPYFRDGALLVGADGRIWVGVHTAAEGEGEALDVFEPDGRYLGRLWAPPGFQPLAAVGERLWGVPGGEEGEQRLVRLAPSPERETPGSGRGG